MKKFILVLNMLMLLFITSIAYASDGIYSKVDSPNVHAYMITGWVTSSDEKTSYEKHFEFADIDIQDKNGEHRDAILDIMNDLVRSGCYVEYVNENQQKSNDIFPRVYIWSKKPIEGEITEEFIRKNLLNAVLLEHGYASVKDKLDYGKYKDILLTLQKEAKENH